MAWQGRQIGLIVIGFAVIFVGGVGIATGRWWMAIVAAVVILVLVVLQVRLIRHRKDPTVEHEA